MPCVHGHTYNVDTHARMPTWSSSSGISNIELVGFKNMICSFVTDSTDLLFPFSELFFVIEQL